MMQANLFDWVPPKIMGSRDGVTFDARRDGDRLDGQAADVFCAMSDGAWHTLAELSAATGWPEASVSARIRDFRKVGYSVPKEYVRRGLWRYRLEMQ